MQTTKSPDSATTLTSASQPTAELAFCTDLAETATARVPALPADLTAAPAQLAHVVFQTNDVPRMRDWWRLLLGGSALFSSNEMEFISFDAEHHRVAILKRNQVEEKGRDITTAGFHHVAFSYSSLEHLISNYKRLKAKQVIPYRTIHHGTTISNYYMDPDMNRVELQVDAFRDTESLNAWLATRQFNANPVGTLFDFEEMVQKFEAGEPVESLMRPPVSVVQ